MTQQLFLSSIFAIFLVLLPIASKAQEFDPNFIITDDEITDFDSMNLFEIYDFLKSRNSFLADYITKDFDYAIRSAVDMIYLASQNYKINPKYTLVLLQKEQGLIETKSPTQRDLEWATGYGICDSCTTTDQSVQKFKGFGKQIDNGVGFMRFFLDNPDKSEPFTIGHTVTVKDRVNGGYEEYEITPVNQSTANLYKYTPHYQGNYSFWQIWSKYFSQSYPDGTLVTLIGQNDIWLIQKGKKRKFKSYGVFLSRYNPDKIVKINKTDLDNFPEGILVNFPQYSYLRSPHGTVYLIIDDKRHGFVSQDALRLLGINPEEIIDVTWEELSPYEESKPITIESAYPTGALLQNNRTGGVYYVENGEKFPIWSKEIMINVYANKKIIPVTPEELDKYETKTPVKFKDGELIKDRNKPDVYIISNGKRFPILSGEIFEKKGYTWDNIIITNEKSVLLHQLGEIIK